MTTIVPTMRRPRLLARCLGALLAQDMAPARYEIVVVGDAARWGVSLGQQCKSIYNALLYKRHPALYRARIQATPPWRYYLTLGALLLALWGALTGHKRMATAGGGL